MMIPGVSPAENQFIWILLYQIKPIKRFSQTFEREINENQVTWY
jgi:hypothetical protein